LGLSDNGYNFRLIIVAVGILITLVFDYVEVTIDCFISEEVSVILKVDMLLTVKSDSGPHNCVVIVEQRNEADIWRAIFMDEHFLHHTQLLDATL
jgi:hypothetical protein